ncbi:MAG: hypothetical protein J6K45_05030 [Clostridia bacterium]|nr:hypothetical protein [Clostridia bacterium]
MQILYLEDEEEKRIRAENMKLKASNEELRNDNEEKELQIYHLKKELKELKQKNIRLEDCDVILLKKRRS